MCCSVLKRGLLVLSAMGGLVLLIAFGGSAEPTPDDHTLTLTQVIEIALDESLVLNAADQIVRAAEAGIDQAFAYPNPSVRIQMDNEVTQFSGKSSDALRSIGVSQTVLTGRKRGLRRDVARRTHMSTAAYHDDLRVQVQSEVKKAFYEVLAVEELLGIDTDHVASLEDFRVKSNARHAAGDIPLMDLIKIRVDVDQARAELMRTRMRVDLATARLNTLMGRVPTTSLRIQGTLSLPPQTPDLPSLLTRALAGRADLKALEAARQAEEKRGKLARAANLPDVTVHVFRNRELIVKPQDVFGAAIEIPLPIWNRRRGDIAAARAMVHRVQYEIDQRQRDIRLDVEKASTRFRQATQQVTFLRRDAIARSQQAVTLTMKAYREAEGNALAVLDSLRLLRAVSVQRIEALHAANAAIADLERAVGGDMELQGDGL